MGHTEDAFPAAHNHLYVVHADITEKCGRRERFSSLCYAGHLPGFCMNVNEHGLVYTINIIEPVHVYNNKTRILCTILKIIMLHLRFLFTQHVIFSRGQCSAPGI